MNRKVQVSMSFQMTSGELELIDDDYEMTDEELMQYAKDCFMEDIYSCWNDEELMDMIHAEIIHD